MLGNIDAYGAGQAEAGGRQQEVLKITLPMEKSNSVYLYAVETGERLVLFDAGPPSAEAKQMLCKAVDLDRLACVFITHCHIDHAGLMCFLGDEVGAEVVVSEFDVLKYQRQDERYRLLTEILRQFGFPAGETREMIEMWQRIEGEMPLPEKFTVLEQSGQLSKTLGVQFLHCPGHSQSDIIYLLDNYAFSGDVLLDKLFQTPLLDVDVETFSGRFSNYASYCSTLPKFAELARRKVLPSHRGEISCVDEVVEFFISKLISRARIVAPVLNSGKNIYETANVLVDRKKLSPFLFYLKVSEMVFIDDFLKAPHLLAEALEKYGINDRLTLLLDEIQKIA